MKRNDSGEPRWFWPYFVVSSLVGIAILVGLVIVAWHFAAKYW